MPEKKYQNRFFALSLDIFFSLSFFKIKLLFSSALRRKKKPRLSVRSKHKTNVKFALSIAADFVSVSPLVRQKLNFN